MTKFLLDSNILVYLVDSSAGQKHTIAKKILEDALKEGNAVLSVQNLAEFSRVASEKIKSKLSYEDTADFVKLFAGSFQILTYNAGTVAFGLEISKSKQVHFFDALLLATMNENGIKQIITENTSDFKKIKWLKVVDPFK